jgi:hypothetical protein
MQNARACGDRFPSFDRLLRSLARARLGLGEIALRAPPELDAAVWASEVVRAAAILYAAGERELVISFATDLAERSSDVRALMGLAELAARHEDARTTLSIGRTALARGFALDLYAFPNFGVPRYSPIGPAVDASITYSVVRTESSFDPQDKSPANAVGLMQVTPESARDTAGRFHATYDWKRMVRSDLQCANGSRRTGRVAARLPRLLRDDFCRLQRGRGRVAEWVKAHWRSARSQRSTRGLGRTHSDRGNAQLRAAGDGKPFRSIACASAPGSRRQQKVGRQPRRRCWRNGRPAALTGQGRRRRLHDFARNSRWRDEGAQCRAAAFCLPFPPFPYWRPTSPH